MELSIGHTFLENNMGADFLANLSCRERKKIFFVDWESVPNHPKGILTTDRCGLPNFTCKKLRKSNF